MNKLSPCLVVLACAGFCGAAPAAVRPHALFSDHMVLQQGLPLPVWGTAAPGEKVTVALGGAEEKATVADSEGRWQVVLSPRQASTEPGELVIRGENEVRIRDVLIGEVWLGSGQSNMELRLPRTLDFARVKQAAGEGRYPQIRFFKMPRVAADEPPQTTDARWAVLMSESVEELSAVLFYFGEALQQARPGTPVGLIQAAIGGTSAMSWLPPEVVRDTPSLEPLRRWYAEELEKYPARKPKYEADLEQYREKVAALKQKGEEIPKSLSKPPREPMNAGHPRRPSGYYNGMIAPLMPCALRGVLWYQGESDSERAEYYDAMMEALIAGWRAGWAEAGGQPELGDFFFLQAQLPNHIRTTDWTVLREKQMKVAERVPRVGIISLIDVGDPNDVHPADKTPVGERFARLARAMAYGEKITPTSPKVRKAEFSGGEVVLEFDHAGEGLVSGDGRPLRNFELAGKDGTFVPAAATIAGDRVKVTAAGISKPSAVRYAWANNPEPVNFRNAEGLPAFPFQIDSLKQTSENPH